MGFGPMTGRAAGWCAGFPGPGYVNPVAGRGFGRRYGRAFGRGLGWGRGRGFGGFRGAWGVGPWARGWFDTPPPQGAPTNLADPGQETAYLKNQAESLSAWLDEINQRIQTLQKQNPEE